MADNACGVPYIAPTWEEGGGCTANGCDELDGRSSHGQRLGQPRTSIGTSRCASTSSRRDEGGLRFEGETTTHWLASRATTSCRLFLSQWYPSMDFVPEAFREEGTQKIDMNWPPWVSLLSQNAGFTQKRSVGAPGLLRGAVLIQIQLSPPPPSLLQNLRHASTSSRASSTPSCRSQCHLHSISMPLHLALYWLKEH